MNVLRFLIPSLALLFGQSLPFPGPGGAAVPSSVNWLHVNAAANSGATPYSLPLGFTPASGSLLLVGCSTFGGAPMISDNSSGPADVYTSIASPLNYSLTYYMASWATVVSTGTAPTTVTCTSTTGTVYICVDYYTGNPPTVILDGSAATATGYGETQAATFVTGSQAGDLLWSFRAASTGYWPSVNSPFILRTSLAYAASSDDGVSSGISANTSQTATYTTSASVYWGCSVIGLKNH
jgi:hypothetical protein